MKIIWKEKKKWVLHLFRRSVKLFPPFFRRLVKLFYLFRRIVKPFHIFRKLFKPFHLFKETSHSISLGSQ